MTNRVPTTPQEMSKDTIDSLQDLLGALEDSREYLLEAADAIKDDEMVASTLREISSERKAIGEFIGGVVPTVGDRPVDEGTLAGDLRRIWTAWRASLNAGDPRVVLIEAERAEDAIVGQFKSILPEIAGNPVNDKLNECFRKVQSGHDRILALRNAYTN